MPALVLDTEAVSALAHPKSRGATSLRAFAVRLGGAVIATADPEDLKALAADHPNIKIWPL